MLRNKTYGMNNVNEIKLEISKAVSVIYVKDLFDLPTDYSKIEKIFMKVNLQSYNIHGKKKIKNRSVK